MIHIVAELVQQAAETACSGCRDGEPVGFEFDYAYQPIVDCASHAIYAHEALVRGPNGESAASVLSQVTPANVYRFDQACRVKAVIGAARLGMRERLSINFLANAVFRPEVCIRSTLEAARAHNFPVEQIIFEVTEGERVRDRAHLMTIFREYQRFGFQTAIDDFGAGYAGLHLLADYQPDIIKIDMDLVRGIDSSAPRQAIVRAITAMCRDLGIRMVAEGIETAAERDFLRDAGIDLMQGYFFCRPVFQGLGEVPEAAWQ
jgi:EAL domain-containing protein (putative c-di-GMP-specific phosphodiesterase class I)